MLKSFSCILLAGNNADALTCIQHLIIKQQQNIEIVTCTPVDILQQVRKCKPVMVLFCLYPNKNSTAVNVKLLRDSEAFDDIPLYIYTNPPTEEDIRTLLMKVPPRPKGE